MGYLALYRKYRPTNFSEVVGQEVVIKTLKNSIKSGNINHAFLFSGPRGTGKTSIAKIFAKSINCINPKEGEMCGICEICKAIKENDIDIIEIDAASNNGVDEIREIRNNAKLVPTIGKYKIYIIDEVHMLSIGAFNALLKTLEEPPAHVIFILATTEIQKIPLTILSRCQRFDFKKITENHIIEMLSRILKKENKIISKETLSAIAKLSDGALRDAINLLDQLLTNCGEEATIEDIYSLTGDIPDNKIEQLFVSLINRDIPEVLNYINTFTEEGKNLNSIVNKIILLVRNININNNVKDYFNEEYSSKLEKFNNISNLESTLIANKLLNISSEIKKTNNQKLIFEIGMLEIIESITPKKEEKLEIIEKKETMKKEETDEIISREIISVRINNVLSGADKIKLKEYKDMFLGLTDYVSSKKYNKIVNILLKGKIIVASDNYIMFEYIKETDLNMFYNNILLIEKFLLEVLEINCKIVAVSEKEWKEIKESYVNNIKNGIKYSLKEEPKIKEQKKKNKTPLVAADIFGEENLDIR